MQTSVIFAGTWRAVPTAPAQNFVLPDAVPTQHFEDRAGYPYSHRMYARSFAIVALLAGFAEPEGKDGSNEQDASGRGPDTTERDAEDLDEVDLPELRPGVDLYDESTWSGYTKREKAKLRAEVERRNAMAEERIRRARDRWEDETPEPQPSPSSKPKDAVKRVCRREDFESFDDFVACRTAGIPEQTAPRPTVALAPVVERPELPPRHRREQQELRESEDQSFVDDDVMNAAIDDIAIDRPTTNPVTPGIPTTHRKPRAEAGTTLRG